jgi:glycosyltransferase involved in cell wall biosynthesis
LVTGHDLKFIQPLIERLTASPVFEVVTELHKDHDMADKTSAEKHLPWADAVFCEWAMGNAVWFSRHKRPGQTLVVRLHLQEVQARLPFLWQINWQAVDHLVCICHHTYDWLCAEFPVLRGKAIIVYNPIDAVGARALPKIPHSEFNLGFVGMVPHRKRLDIAFDIFSSLRDIDERYTLHVKGRKPDDYPWMRNRKDEIAWYRTLEQRIESSPHRNAVVFDPHGPDMPAWYSAMGFILSTSDFEGSHQAIAEGMAAGCIPIIRNWEGADRIYPGRFQFDQVEHAVSMIRHWHSPGLYMETAQVCREYAQSHFDSALILEKLELLLATGIYRPSLVPKSKPGINPGIAVLGYLLPGTRNGYRIRIEQEIKQLRNITDNLTLIVLHQQAAASDLEAHARELESLGARVRLVEITDFFAINLTENKALPAIMEIERILAEHDVSVLYAEALYCMRVAGMIAPRCTNVRIVFDNHGVNPEESAMNGARPYRVKALEGLEREALLTADLNIFVSNQMANHYAAKYDLPSYEYLTLPCCVEQKFFSGRALPSGVELPAERLILCYVGSLAVWQCGEEMLSLFSKLYQRDSTLFFLLLTPASEHESARIAAAAAGIPEDAVLVKEVTHDQVPACLQRVDVGLLLRRDDPVNRVSSPTKFAEYLAAGVPVLMTDVIGDYSADSSSENLGLVLRADELLTAQIKNRTLVRIEAFLHDVHIHRRVWADRCRDYARDNLAWESCIVRLYDHLQIKNSEVNHSSPDDDAQYSRLIAVQARLDDASHRYRKAQDNITSLKEQLAKETATRSNVEQQLAKETATRSTIEQQLILTRGSLTYRLGYHVRNATTSVRGFVRLPLALYRISKTHKTRNKKLISNHKAQFTSNHYDKEDNDAINLKIKSGAYGWPPIDKDNEKPTILAIADEFTAGCFRDDANLIQPRPDNWAALIKRDKPTLAFIESAWKGNYGSWQYRVAKYANKPGDEVKALSEYSRANGIPVVFWNKEDPVHHDKFMDSAKVADVIFTTDANMVKSYQEKTGNKQVYPLPFAAQPSLHKPSSLTGRINKTCFAGSWYGGRHVERGAAMQWLLKAAKPLGLDIYDRNYKTGVFPFPEEYQECIKGSLPYEALCKEYRRYRVFLNVNSVTKSPTMFSRRVFELLASGTPVVSTYSQGIEELFGTDIVWLVEDKKEAEHAIQTLLTDEKEWRRRSLLGIRKVFTSHTYMHRLQYIYEKVGVKFNGHVEPSVLLTARVKSHAEFERLVDFATNQSWRGFTLYVEQFSRSHVAISYPSSIKLVSKGYFSSADFKQTLDGYDFAGWINPDANYGSHYLQDLINATRFAPDSEAWGKSSTHVEFAFDAPVYTFAAIQRVRCFASNGMENPKVGSLQSVNIYCLDREEYRHAEVKPFLRGGP